MFFLQYDELLWSADRANRFIDFSIDHESFCYASPSSWHVQSTSSGPSNHWYWIRSVDFGVFGCFLKKMGPGSKFDSEERCPKNTLYEDISFGHLVDTVCMVKMGCCLLRLWHYLGLKNCSKYHPKMTYYSINCITTIMAIGAIKIVGFCYLYHHR